MERLKLSIHFSFYLLLISAVIFFFFYLLAMYTIAMLLHECAHYRVALSRRYKCNSMKLSAFGAVLYGKFDDVNPDDAMAIALAGPCANIVAAVICLALWWTIPSAYVFTDVFFNANVSMALVNLLPCYPLDGGRIVGALWDKKGKSGYDNSRRLTAVISAVLFAVFVLSVFLHYDLFSMGLFAVFLFSSLIGKDNVHFMRIAPFVFNSRTMTAGMELRTLVFGGNTTLKTVIRRMQGGFLYNVKVVNEKFESLATIDAAKLQYMALHFPQQTTLYEALEKLKISPAEKERGG